MDDVKRCIRRLLDIAPDTAITAGGACIVNGIYQLLPAAGWIAAGILLIAFALLWIGGNKK